MTKKGMFNRPPMGWNSYDYYDTTVTEDEIRENAEYIAKHMKEYGWSYIVIDIEWYSYYSGSMQPKYQYIPFGKVEMDEYGRLLPCVDKFPSSKDGKGFAPLADYIHSLGLKFGIHIMRGLPRIAAHMHMPILNSNQTANEIADPSSICLWNPDMYGLRPDEIGSQEYYNSIFQLYASWGVDFVKCDDICRMDMPSARDEICMLHKAIENCGREILLSLSPGPAIISEAWWYEENANMWRITDDLWDNWELLYAMFECCEVWQKHVSCGSYPDLDMLPFGSLGRGFGKERKCELTKEEQETMMTLWCIFGSPLMLGACPIKLDEWTLKLLTNKKLLHMQQYGEEARQLWRNEESAAWLSMDKENKEYYFAVFNFLTKDLEKNINLFEYIKATDYKIDNIINSEDIIISKKELLITIKSHGVVAFIIKSLL